MAGRGRGRPRRRAARRPLASVHARGAVPEGQPLPRRGQRPRPRDAPAAADRRQGRGGVRGDRLGRGAGGERRRPALGDRAARPRVGAAVLLRGHGGHGPGLDHGPAPVRRDGRLAPADDDLHGGGERRAERDLRRLRRHGRGGLRARAARDPVGRQPALDEPPPVALRARRPAARRPRGRDRPAAHRHRRALRRAHRPAPGHRRRARARAHARRARRGRRGPRLARAPHRGLARARGAPGGVAGRAGRGDLRPARRDRHRRWAAASRTRGRRRSASASGSSATAARARRCARFSRCRR